MMFRSLGEAAARRLRRQRQTLQLLALTRRGVAPVNVRAGRSKAAAGAALLSAAALGSLAAGASGFSSSAGAEASRATQADAPLHLATADEFLFPETQPYRTGSLQVSPVHALYFEECGNPLGKVRGSYSRRVGTSMA